VLGYGQSVFFLLFGSSAAGKSFVLRGLAQRVPDLAIHDFDEIGVPAGADTEWRHAANEKWVRKAIDCQAAGTDLLLAGQTPFGELLATPSAPQLEAISACLLDCDDETRVERLNRRGPESLAGTAGNAEAYLNWAEWMRRHAHDSTWQINVIRRPATEQDMVWDRWTPWPTGDPRWRVQVIDTSALPVEKVADELAAWIARERTLLAEGKHPLLRWAEDDESS
jgi:hypothetical protein